MLSPYSIGKMFYRAAYNTVYHDGIEHAGYLAFIGLLALFPFMVLIVAFAGLFGEGEAGAAFIRLVFSELPPNMVKALAPRVTEIVSGPPQGLLTVSILGALWTCSSGVEGYRTVLNRAYHVGNPPSYLLRRVISILQVLIVAMLIILSMVTLVILPLLLQNLGLLSVTSSPDNLPLGSKIAYTSFAILFFLVSVIYYVLPNIKQNVHSVLPGAALVTLLWTLSARLLSYYLSQFSQVNLIYGSLGGVIAALLFFYISNIIFIYGAEFNYLLKTALGEKIEQKRAVQAEINHL